MGSEKELVPVIERISRRSKNIEEAIAGVAAALTAEVGQATLLVQEEDDQLSPFSLRAVSSFLDSRTFPFRGVYTAPLRVGRLIVCFGGFGGPGRFFQELTNRIATELGALQGRVQGAAS